MKKLSLMLIAATLFSCGNNSTNSTQNAENQSAETKTEQSQPEQKKSVASLKMKKNRADDPSVPNITMLKITADSLFIIQDDKELAYKIDRKKSKETVNEPYKYYVWNFSIEKSNAQLPDFQEIQVQQYMPEIYGEPDQFSSNLCFITAKSNGGDEAMNSYTITEIQGLNRKLLDNYPQSKPYPELVFDVNKFNAFQNTKAQMPDFVVNAKKITVKGSKITFFDGTKSTDLEILPLSDLENVYSEGYNWLFVTKAENGMPSVEWNINTGFPTRWAEVPENERGSMLTIQDCGYFDVKFKSWDNLKRGISACYPNDQVYEDIMEQGVLPDNGDDEEEYLGDDPNGAAIERCCDIWNEIKSDYLEVPIVDREEVGMNEDHVVKIEGLTSKGATAYEVNIYTLELGQDFKIYYYDTENSQQYTVKAFIYGQLGVQEVELEPELAKAVNGIGDSGGVFHFDGNNFTAYRNEKLSAELVFDYDKQKFLKK